MGVANLWQLVQPTGHEVQLETLRNKIVAVDASIWIYTFIRSLHNHGEFSYLLGFLKRIAKLLYYGIRPVFVFDGRPPQLKKRVINARRNKNEFDPKKLALQIMNDPKIIHNINPKNDMYKMPFVNNKFTNSNNDIRMPLLPQEFVNAFEQYQHVSTLHRNSRSSNTQQQLEIHSTTDPLEFSKMQVRNVQYRHNVTNELHKVIGMNQEKPLLGNRLKSYKFSKSTSNVQDFHPESNWFDDTTDNDHQLFNTCDKTESLYVEDSQNIELHSENNSVIDLISSESEFEDVAPSADTPFNADIDWFIASWQPFAPPRTFKIFDSTIFYDLFQLSGTDIKAKIAELSKYRDSAFKESYLYIIQYLDAILEYKHMNTGYRNFKPEPTKSKPSFSYATNDVVKPQNQSSLIRLFQTAPKIQKIKIIKNEKLFKINYESPSLPDMPKADEISENNIELAIVDTNLMDTDTSIVNEIHHAQVSGVKSEDLSNDPSKATQPTALGSNPVQSATISSEMLLECMHLLKLFGIPYIVAPQEAEAQCAYLNQNKLVDGIITDDSDVFLFGGIDIYRHIFKNNMQVEHFNTEQIQSDLSLNRQDFVDLAQLLGSDYCLGYKGVGLITAMEILLEFGDLKGFNRYCMQIQSGHKNDRNDKFKTIAKKVLIPNAYEIQQIEDAYLRPIVDENKEEFVFGEILLEELKDFLNMKLKWEHSKTEELLGPVIEAQKNRKLSGYQQTLNFSKSGKEINYGSKRLTQVMELFRQR
eukprot:NODE_33_length_32023_cov_0.217579.p1 type:complete len:756 gc:universal NODE_33_length_32023_cov_0.217579:24218-26485(+)